MKYNGKYIGANHTASGMRFGGINSSFKEIFKDEEVLIGSGFDIIPCQIGNINECYQILKDKIEQKKPIKFETLCEIVFEVVQNYFGDYSNIEKRMDNYTELDFIQTKEDIGKVSNLKGKNRAMCTERAMLSQNLLKSIGINSIFKCSSIINNDKEEIHAYNILEHNKKYYIYDATIPTYKNNIITPIIIEIPKEVYEKIISPEQGVGYSVEVTHYNPLMKNEKHIIYDAGREQIYQQKIKNPFHK